MDIQYRRDMNHTYMVLESTDAAVLESYETRIILTNRIGGLLPCSLQYLDNRTCFCYDTTSRQSLATDLEGREITRREMQKILGNILSVMTRMEEYLLSLRHLVLTPEQIFLVPATMEVWLCFAPFYDSGAKEGLLGVTEFLLSHTGKDSQDAIILGSRFSHALRQPNIQLSDLEHILYGEMSGDDGRAGNAGIPPESGSWAAGEEAHENWSRTQYAGPGAGADAPQGRGLRRFGRTEAASGADAASLQGSGRQRFGRTGSASGAGADSLQGSGRQRFGRTDSNPDAGADTGRRKQKGPADGPGQGAGGAFEYARSGAGRQGIPSAGRPDSISARDTDGEKAQKGTRRLKVNWYVVAVVLAGAVLAAGVYVFLHYYNGKLPPWPVLAGIGAAVAAAVTLVIIIRRKALKKPWPEEGEKEAYAPFDTGTAASPYQKAYSSALGMDGKHTAFESAAAMGRPDYAFAYSRGVNGTPTAYGSAEGVNGAQAAYGKTEGVNRTAPASGNAAGMTGTPITSGNAGSGNMGYGSQAGAGGPFSTSGGMMGMGGADASYGTSLNSTVGDGTAGIWNGNPLSGGLGPGRTAGEEMNGALLSASGRGMSLPPDQEPGLTTILAPPREGLPEAFLIPENGSEAGREIRLDSARTRIGKLAGKADICSDSPAVSRLHAEIIRKGEAFSIRDLNSRNGTKVNGEILAGNAERLLRDGDRLSLADRVFIFRQRGPEEQKLEESPLGEPVSEQ